MNISSIFPFHLHWTAQDLADAVPLRLFELFAFDAGTQGADLERSANQLPRRRLRGGYASPGPLPDFIRVHS